jgi:hypothetical protein
VGIVTVLLKVAAPVVVKEVNVVAPATLTVEEKFPAAALKFPVKVNEVPVATPITGVTKVGVFAKTNAPVPVSSVIADIKFTLVGVAKKVATPVPNPLTPVEIGKPVPFVKVTEVGVPKIGVVKTGLVNVLFVKVSVPAIVANVPVALGSVIVVVPAIAGAKTFADPEVEPL